MWWWLTSICKLNEEKLGLSLEELKKLTLSLPENFNENNFYYFAEIWVESSMRGLDIAWKLYRSQINGIINLWVRDVMVRTTMKTDLPYKWFIDLWYVPVYEYWDDQERVILVLRK